MTESKRRTAWFNAAGRQVELYEMTDGQRIAMAAVNARDNRAVVQRLWQVLESLFVDPADFERLDTAVVTGKVDWPAMEKFSQDVAGYEWPPKVEMKPVPAEWQNAAGVGYGRGEMTNSQSIPDSTYLPHQDDTIRRTVDATPEARTPVPDTFRPLPKQFDDSMPRSPSEPY